MKSVGIICEYNPFHNGHLYHLNKVKEMFNGYTIVLVMSGNFTQRGEASIIDKWDKTEIALNYGVDLVIEIPFVFATQSADTFAKASITLLDAVGVDYIVFGSETNNIDKLTEMANIQLKNKNYDKIVKEYLNQGINYPSALSKALFDITGSKVSKPNDILGISYIREILKLNSSIKPMCIKRNNDYNSIHLEDDITSATSIRYALKHKDNVHKYVPLYSNTFLSDNLFFIENYFPLLKFKILTDLNNLAKYQTVDEGIENRIAKSIINCKSLDELILKIKTKRYTYNKLNRMFTHILCNFTKEESKKFNTPEYIRVLGFNKNGQNYLKYIKNGSKLPIITNYSTINSSMLDLEFRSTCVYSSILNEKDKIKLIESEYKNSPIIK
ncbi:MAG: nucleotidyltransferase [Bacilli bacterium]